MLIPEGLLQCSVEASSKEVIETVARIVEEVADEFGANAAVALSKAKAYVSEKADESEEFLAPWEVGDEVFEDEPLQRRFEEAAGRAEPCPIACPWRRRWLSAWRRITRFVPIRALKSRFPPSSPTTPIS